MNNLKVIEILTRLMILRQLESNKDETIKSHQKAAYEKVINGIKSYPYNFSSAKEIVQNVPGVGKNIEKYLNQIFSINDPIKTGVFDIDKYLETNVSAFNQLVIMADLMKVSGVGIKKALELYNQGYTSASQLPQPTQFSPEISQVTPKTNRQLITSNYLFELQKRIPHDKITYFGNILTQFLNGLNIQFTITGSYRRKTLNSKDIDIIFYGPNVVNAGKQLVERLKNAHIVKETLALGNNKFEGIAYLDDEFPAVRVDFLFLQDVKEYPYALLYFTGSKNFNIQMKSHAKNMGITLGNLEMYKINSFGIKENAYVNSEEEIFSILGLNYVIPEHRNI